MGVFSPQFISYLYYTCIWFHDTNFFYSSTQLTHLVPQSHNVLSSSHQATETDSLQPHQIGSNCREFQQCISIGATTQLTDMFPGLAVIKKMSSFWWERTVCVIQLPFVALQGFLFNMLELVCLFSTGISSQTHVECNLLHLLLLSFLI